MPSVTILRPVPMGRPLTVPRNSWRVVTVVVPVPDMVPPGQSSVATFRLPAPAMPAVSVSVVNVDASVASLSVNREVLRTGRVLRIARTDAVVLMLTSPPSPLMQTTSVAPGHT